MRELNVVEVRLDDEQGSPVLILKESDGERQVAIWMSAAGAAGILGALQEADPDHPSSHELILALIASLDGEVSVAHIVGHQNGVFYAELIVDGRPVNARPSDAIAVALRAGCRSRSPRRCWTLSVWCPRRPPRTTMTTSLRVRTRSNSSGSSSIR